MNLIVSLSKANPLVLRFPLMKTTLLHLYQRILFLSFETVRSIKVFDLFSHYFSLSGLKKSKKKRDVIMNKVAGFNFKFTRVLAQK